MSDKTYHKLCIFTSHLCRWTAPFQMRKMGGDSTPSRSALPESLSSVNRNTDRACFQGDPLPMHRLDKLLPGDAPGPVRIESEWHTHARRLIQGLQLTDLDPWVPF
jgi:hypothetical protein